MNTIDKRYKCCTIYFLAHKDDVDTKKNIYIGHTIETPKDRWRKHIAHCNNENSSKYSTKVYRYIRQNGGIDNWTFNILLLFPCDNLNQAVSKEIEFISIFPNNLNTRFSNSYLDIKDETDLNIIEKNKIAKKKQADYMKEYRKKQREKLILARENIERMSFDI
jgi:hypothetical protein